MFVYRDTGICFQAQDATSILDAQSSKSVGSIPDIERLPDNRWAPTQTSLRGDNTPLYIKKGISYHEITQNWPTP